MIFTPELEMLGYKKGLSQVELAKRMNEKIGVIQKAESDSAYRFANF